MIGSNVHSFPLFRLEKALSCGSAVECVAAAGLPGHHPSPLVAVALEGGDVLLRVSSPRSVSSPVLVRLPHHRKVAAMAWDATAQWLAVVREDGALALVPALFLLTLSRKQTPFDDASTSSVVAIQLSGISTARACVWWRAGRRNFCFVAATPALPSIPSLRTSSTLHSISNNPAASVIACVELDGGKEVFRIVLPEGAAARRLSVQQASTQSSPSHLFVMLESGDSLRYTLTNDPPGWEGSVKDKGSGAVQPLLLRNVHCEVVTRFHRRSRVTVAHSADKVMLYGDDDEFMRYPLYAYRLPTAYKGSRLVYPALGDHVLFAGGSDGMSLAVVSCILSECNISNTPNDHLPSANSRAAMLQLLSPDESDGPIVGILPSIVRFSPLLSVVIVFRF